MASDGTAAASGGRTVLLSPLDWGLGHAARCVPVVRALRRRGWRVVCCSDGAPLALMRAEFPDLEFRRVASTPIRYPKRGRAMPLAMLLQVPKIVLATRALRRRTEELCAECGAALTISDNRPGFRADGVKSVYMTHQMRLKAPRGLAFLEGLAERLHAFAARGFSKIWIPDLPGAESLAGSLGGRDEARRVRIGLLSRFAPRACAPEAVEASRGEDGARTALRADRPVLALLSGPEPQRTLFERKIAEQLRALGAPATIVRGLAPSAAAANPVPLEAPNVRWIPFAAAEEISALLAECSLVVARAGYSTLMDLVHTGTRALLVPTPGQTEQEYLAGRLLESGAALCVRQDELDLAAQIPEALRFPGLGGGDRAARSAELLDRAIRDLEESDG